MNVTSWELRNGVLELVSDSGVLNFHGVDAVTFNSLNMSPEDYMRINNEIHTRRTFSQEDFENLIENAAYAEQEGMEEIRIHPSVPPLNNETFDSLISSLSN